MVTPEFHSRKCWKFGDANLPLLGIPPLALLVMIFMRLSLLGSSLSVLRVRRALDSSISASEVRHALTLCVGFQQLYRCLSRIDDLMVRDIEIQSNQYR